MMTIFTLNDRFTFGKYKGKLLRNIIRDDPEYVFWCEEKVDYFELDANASEALEFSIVNIDWEVDEIGENDELRRRTRSMAEFTE